MTLFEYLAIAYTLVLSFAAMRLIEGLPDVFAPGRRHWIHAVFVLAALFTCITSFWGFWSFRDASWNLVLFVAALCTPGSLYFIACTLIPRESASVESWREHLASVRTRYFAAILCFATSITVVTSLILGIPLTSPVRLMQLVIFVSAVAGIASRSERVLVAVALAYLLAFVVAVGLMLRPGSLATL